MAQDQHKRQKALAKKKQRESQIRKKSNIARNPSYVDLVRSTQHGQWYGCYEMAAEGMYNITCAKNSSDGPVGFTFLVDLYCLGVKSVEVLRGVDLRNLTEFVQERDGRSVTPAYALKIIQFAVEEAKKLGFEPPAKLSGVLQIFSGVDPLECDETFEFGRDGKPLYVPGPDDTPYDQRQVLDKLQSLGAGNFHFALQGQSVEET